MIRLAVAAVVFVALTSASAMAEVTKEITWDTLIPATMPLKDPFPHLTFNQRIALENIAGIRELKARGLVSEVGSEFELAVELTYKLRSEGLDVEALLEQYADFIAEVDRLNEAVVGDLDGQLVRMPGYALPLEFSGTGVKEFLLVPYVGACIHVPPPPINQTVYVSLDQAFVAEDLYTPVWVTGRMRVSRTSKSLSLVDGQSAVAAGYSLEGLKVELYTE